MPVSGSPKAAPRRWRQGPHQAQGLDVDEITAAVEIEEPAGPQLALRLAGVFRSWYGQFDSSLMLPSKL